MRRPPGGDGRRIASLFRQARGLSDDKRACDLGAILAADEIHKVVSECADPGYTACLVCPPDRDACPSGILLGSWPDSRQRAVLNRASSWVTTTSPLIGRSRPAGVVTTT